MDSVVFIMAHIPSNRQGMGHSKPDMDAWGKEGTADTETTILLLLACRRILMTKIRIKHYFIYLQSFIFMLSIYVPHLWQHWSPFWHSAGMLLFLNDGWLFISSKRNLFFPFPLVMKILVISGFLWNRTQKAPVTGSCYIYRVLAVPHTLTSLLLLLPCMSTILSLEEQLSNDYQCQIPSSVIYE